MLSILAAIKIPLTTLLIIGASVALVVIAWSYSNWRSAVKIACVAVLVEGAIRKWILPGGQELVYFMKDVFLVGAYMRFYFAPDAELRAYRVRVPGTFIFLLAIVVSFSALNPNIGSILLSLYGLKIYFMYVPLAFMMPYLFTNQKEMVQQLTWYVLLAIPICMLGFLQYSSDRFSVINTFAAGMADTGATGFGVGDRARITGTFSYLTGHTTFVIVFYTLALVLLSLQETRRKWIIAGIVIPFLAGNALMGGSRASVATMGFVTIGFAMSAMSRRLGTSRNFIGILLVGGALAVSGAIYLFGDALTHWEARLTSSGETITQRTVGMTSYAVTKALHQGGLFGFGIGTAHPATEAIRQKLKLPAVREKVPVFDNEMGQVLVELGALGFVSWYALRVLMLWLAWQSFSLSPPGVVRSLALASVVIMAPYVFMSVVFNHTANFLLFALSGLSMVTFLEPAVQRRFARGRLTRSPHAVSNRPPS